MNNTAQNTVFTLCRHSLGGLAQMYTALPPSLCFALHYKFIMWQERRFSF